MNLENNRISNGTTSGEKPSEKTAWVGKAEIARRYGVSTRTINEWMRQRVIPYFKIGGKTVRFDIAKCDAALGYYEQSTTTGN